MDKLRKSWKLYVVLVCAVLGLAYAGFKIATGPDTQEPTAQGESQSPTGTERDNQTPTVPPTQDPAETNPTHVPETTIKPESQEAGESGITDVKKQTGTTNQGTTSGTEQSATRPTGGNEPKTEEPQVHNHTWGAWTYKNDEEERRICSSCQKEETRPHSFAKVETIYQDTEDGFHQVTEKYTCTTCQTAKYENTFRLPHQYGDGKKTAEPNQDGTHTITTTWECKDCKNVRTEEKYEKCQFGNWVFDKKSKDVRSCSVCCYEETRPHQTVEQPTTNPNYPSRPGSTGGTHQHTWSEWDYQSDEKEARTCSSCKTEETRPHNFAKVSTTSVDKQDGTHEVTEQYVCTTCSSAKYESTFEEPHQYNSGIRNVTANADGTHTVDATYTCTACGNVHTDKTQEECQYGVWKLGENGEDVRKCTQCTNEETRLHEHSQVPADAVYVYQASNNDGTHRLETTYTCTDCGQEATASKDAPCTYGEGITYEKTGVNDIHLVVRDCTVCQYQSKEEGTCEPTGELKLVKVYAQIYEYYDCALCGDWCLRKYHTEHQFEPWKYRDENTHIRYCICVEEREIGNHSYVYDGTTVMNCKECGSTKTVPIHNHGYGVRDNMGLMEILGTEAYYELPNKSQVANPNPSPYSYCSRYEFMCRTCGVAYYIHYDHEFVNGVCTRTGYCGGIAEPQGEGEPQAEPEEELGENQQDGVLPKPEEILGEELTKEDKETNPETEPEPEEEPKPEEEPEKEPE